MNLFAFVKSWKDFSFLWTTSITKLYENLAKYTQPAIDSLYKLKAKIKETPTEVDDYCFDQGVTAIETFANYLLGEVQNLRA